MKKSWFAATRIEFKLRVVFISAIFFGAFWCYAFDHRNTADLMAQWLFRHSLAFSLDGWLRVIACVGAALIFAGAAIRTWGTAYLNSKVMGDWRLHTNRLLADGPYRHVRNPLYLGNIVMSFGIATMLSRSGAALIIIGMFLFVLRLILREEAEMRVGQGESYARYLAAVPRLVPSQLARVPAAGSKPNWLDGFLGELMMWIWGLSLLVYAATLNIPYWEYCFYASFPVHFLVRFIYKRATRPAAGAATA
jgi:protein-S-isoprenylcysteine O-methyltransferase Ste14